MENSSLILAFLQIKEPLSITTR